MTRAIDPRKSELAKRGWEKRKERFGPSGSPPPTEEQRRNRSESAKSGREIHRHAEARKREETLRAAGIAILDDHREPKSEEPRIIPYQEFHEAINRIIEIITDPRRTRFVNQIPEYVAAMEILKEHNRQTDCAG